MKIRDRVLVVPSTRYPSSSYKGEVVGILVEAKQVVVRDEWGGKDKVNMDQVTVLSSPNLNGSDA